MKTINFRRVSNTLSENEMRLVKGGAQEVATEGGPAIGADGYWCSRKECSKQSDCSSYGTCWGGCSDGKKHCA